VSAYYNENDKHAAEWLQNLIDHGQIPHGKVDSRSIKEVEPSDLQGFTQCHFFAGIGGWAHAARLAEWPSDLEIWTGSCPCQPFSISGKRQGVKDERHLWPDFYRLIDACRPARVFGEQVAGKDGLAWFDGVQADMEKSGYAVRGFVIPACAINAPHRRERLWFAADANSKPRDEGRSLIGRGDKGSHEAARPRLAGSCSAGSMGNTAKEQRTQRQSDEKDIQQEQPPIARAGNGYWDRAEWIRCADEKQRRLEPGIALLAYGLPKDVAGALSGFGNAIVPQVGAEVLGAYLDTQRGIKT